MYFNADSSAPLMENAPIIDYQVDNHNPVLYNSAPVPYNPIPYNPSPYIGQQYNPASAPYIGEQYNQPPNAPVVYIDPQSDLQQKKENKDEVQIQIQPSMFHTEERYWGCFKLSPHARALFFNTLVLLSLALIIAAGTLFGILGTDWSKYFLIGAGVAVPITYIVYIIEIMCSSTVSYLRNLLLVEDIVTHINRIRDTAPSIGFHCECYHYETRTRLVSYTHTDSNGRTHLRHRTETYQVKVVSHAESERFHYKKHNDKSGIVTNDLLKYNATRIDFTKQWSPGDAKTLRAYQDQLNNFRRRNERRDTHFNMGETFDIPGYSEKMLAIVDLNKKSYFLTVGWCLFFSLVLLQSWTYRVWMDRVSVKAKYHFNKNVYV
ncbi:3 TM domain-containing transmembrane protein [Acrasis kona]|uniref:3 TM domain-containing transmembrane protein n=1 Tax=Acrasis kona TaxID=1008807 RepID=A0AAW2Z738_9EUKA